MLEIAIERRLLADARARLRPHDEKAAQQVLARCFDRQRGLIADPCPRKACRTPRRAGKTYAATAYLVHRALTKPGADCAYIGLSLKRAKKLLWAQLKALSAHFELECDFNNADLDCRFPNGSLISLGGADSAEAIERYRGSEYDLVIIDECKSFRPSLFDELLDEVLEPALMDRDGTLLLIGTPGSVLAGHFYEITGPEATLVADDGSVHSVPYEERDEPRYSGCERRWSLHSWTIADNTASPHIWEAALAIKKRNGWADSHPIWRREYLGQWQADDGKRVYAFNSVLNTWSGTRLELPPERSAWEFVIGIDLGYRDAFALEVIAYSDTSRTMYHLHEQHEKRLNVTKMAGAIKRAVELCDGEVAMVADYAGTGEAILDELADVHGLYIERAVKREKRDYVELLNAQLATGLVKVLRGSKLAAEMTDLVWDEANPLKEKASLERDCADAFLYAWRAASSLHHFRSPADAPAPGSPEADQRQADAELQRAVERRQKERRGDWSDDAADSDAALEESFEWD